MSKKMKKICWITGGYLLQVDLPILSALSKAYDILWVVIAPEKSNMAKTAKEYAENHSISIEIHSTRGHRYLPFGLIDYVPMCKHLAEMNADIYYCNWTPFPYAWIPFEYYIPKEKLIMAMHHGSIHNGMQLRHLYKYYLKHVCERDVKFQYFSESQANGDSAVRDKNKVTVIPLALNDYGKSSLHPPIDYIQFLSFGHIIETKNLGLLIKAAEEVFELTNKKFKVKIVGQCRLWDELYLPLIKHPEIFELDIRMVPDEQIPDLFASTHYLVLPYKAVTQSGPLRIAYGYNTPVITSNLVGFRESQEDGITGFMFESENLNSLVSLMLKVINGGSTLYEDIKQKQQNYVLRNLSVESVIEKYKKMFDKFE